MRLEAFFQEHYVPNRLRSGSANTIRLYGISIRSFGRTLGRQPNLDDLTDTQLNRHMMRLRSINRAAATINKDRSQLLAIWRYAYHRGFVTNWPDVQPEREPQRIPQAWMADDIRRLFATIDKLEGKLETVDRSLWWRSLLMLCLDTGERIGALRQAQWPWVYRQWITVPAEARKGGRRDRQYLLGSGTIENLKRLKDQTFGPKLFPWPYCEVYIWTKFGEILKEAGLPADRRDKFHRLRRTCASVIHAAGLDATEALDHTHRRTTQAYLDPRFQREDQPSKIMKDWLRGPTKNPKKRSG